MQPLSAITAVILAGGLGTRLRSAVADRPKVLADINGRPFITYLLDRLAAAGVQQTVLCTGYKGDMIEEVLGMEYSGISLSFSHERTPLGTGGALRLALPYMESETVLAMNGDSFFEAELNSFKEWHDGNPYPNSLLLAHVPDISRYGSIQLSPEGRIERFVEKGISTGPGLINAGIYLLDRSLVAEIPPGKTVSIESDIFTPLAGGELGGFPATGKFIDIGVPDDYLLAQTFFLQ